MAIVARALRATILNRAAPALLAAALCGCATGASQAPQAASDHAAAKSTDLKDAIGVDAAFDASAEPRDPVASAAFWSTRFDRNPNDMEAAVKYSQALRKIGSLKESVDVMAKVAQNHGDDTDVQIEYGKSLIQDGRAFEAVRYLETAVGASPTDWRAMSAYGVALDEIGENTLARQQYDHALSINPEAVNVLNNKGMSYALSGDLKRSEMLLRRASSSAGATAKVRQNLALVLALKGDLNEAERLARSDLPPKVADNNIRVFRSMYNQPAYWQGLGAGSYDTPSFDDAPASPEAPAAAPQAPSGPPQQLLVPSPGQKPGQEPGKDEDKGETPDTVAQHSASAPSKASYTAPDSK